MAKLSVSEIKAINAMFFSIAFFLILASGNSNLLSSKTLILNTVNIANNRVPKAPKRREAAPNESSHFRLIKTITIPPIMTPTTPFSNERLQKRVLSL